jgi:arylsulfatase
VGRDDASAVTPDFTAPFRFTGGRIDEVVVDVSGDKSEDHEAQVPACRWRSPSASCMDRMTYP